MTPVGFLPFNPQDHRKDGAAPFMPLKPPADPAALPPADAAGGRPESSRAILLPNGKDPVTFDPTFKDLYLQKREELRKSAEGMEGILVRQVMKAMRSTIPAPEDEEDDLFGSASHATQMFTQMMDDELSDKIAENSEFGIAEKIFKSQINRVTEEFAEQLATGQDRPFGLPLPRRR